VGLERAATEVLPPWVCSYVAGGAGDESTQRGNVDAFARYGIMPRMLVGATQRDLSVSLLGMELPTPLFMRPIGVIDLCSQDFHGDIAVAKAGRGPHGSAARRSRVVQVMPDCYRPCKV